MDQPATGCWPDPRLSAALQAWSAVLGAERVLDADAARARYGADTTGEARYIAGALRPADAGQLPAIVRIAASRRVPLYPISTGRNWGYGSAQPAVDGCVVLDLGGLDRIRHCDRELGTVTVEPGVTQGMLAAFLEREGLPFLVPVSGAGPGASLLGNALERGYGITPGADHFAAVTALEAVLPDGSLYRGALAELGGATIARGFKWGIGPYLDGLFTQSALGVVTSVTIALARRPEQVAGFVFQVGDDGLGAAVAGVREVLRRLPGLVGGINLMNRQRMLAMGMPYPGSTGPGATLPPEQVRAAAARLGIAAWSGFGTLYGTRRTVAAAKAEIRACLRGRARRLVFLTPQGAGRLARCAARLPGWMTGGLARQLGMLAAGLRLVDGQPGEIAMPLCYWRGGAPPAAGRGFDPARDGCGLRWYAPLVPMVPAEVERFAAATAATAAAHGIEPLITLTSLSERCFDSTVPLLFDRGDPAASARAAECHRQLRDQGCAAGWVPYRVGIGEQRWLCDRDDPCWRLVRTIKQAVDPQGIIAPGRYSPLA